MMDFFAPQVLDEFERALQFAIQRWGFIRSGYFYGIRIESAKLDEDGYCVIRCKITM